jgi:hypothetical protein
VYRAVEKEPEYLALVPAGQRRRFNLPPAKDE